MALPRKNRMTKKEFARYFRSGKRISGASCALRFGRSESGNIKAAVVVPSKVVPQAAERNRIRRVLYETIGNLLPLVTHPSFIIVIVRKYPAGDGLSRCGQELTELLEKSAIIRP